MDVNNVLRGAIRIQREEMESRRREAIALVDRLMPHVHSMEMVARECGPVAMFHATAVNAELTRYRRQWDGEEGRVA